MSGILYFKNPGKLFRSKEKKTGDYYAVSGESRDSEIYSSTAKR
jgi:hypothetical protein